MGIPKVNIYDYYDCYKPHPVSCAPYFIGNSKGEGRVCNTPLHFRGINVALRIP